MTTNSDRKPAKDWRAGFELELILGDLGNPRFAQQDPLDIASPAYCQAVARILSQYTGERWTAPRRPPARTGFYVIPEYDIDPITFAYDDQFAGVELLTPPLSFSDADEMRAYIADALEELGGWANIEPSLETSLLGWHINIDPGDLEGPRRRGIRPELYCLGTDEVPMLRASGVSATA